MAVSSYFNSMALAPLPPAGHQGDKIYRGVTYGGSSWDDRILRMGQFKQDAKRPVFPNYSVELSNQDLGLNFLITSRWTGQTLQVDFGYITGSGTDTLTLFSGPGREIEIDGERAHLQAEGKFASLSRKEIGSTNSPLAFTGSNWNPADLFWTVVTCYGELDNTESTANTDIDYTSWSDWKDNIAVINYQVAAALEGVDVMKWIQELADVTQTWIYESGAKLAFNFFTPTHPDSFEAVVVDESNYIGLPVARIGDVANTLKAFHNFDPVSKVWAGEATAVNSNSVGSYGTLEYVWDSELIWHQTSASASTFVNRELINRREGLLDFLVEGEMPLWIHELGDRIFFGCQSWDVTSGSYEVAGLVRNPTTRKITLELQSVERWSQFFFLDDATLGLLDKTYNPIY